MLRRPAGLKFFMPMVSVIMPNFNHARFLVDSIQSVLGQTLSDLELIIVDDCSSDHSSEIIGRFSAVDARIKVMRHERNQGLSRSRNHALELAAGELIAFCDADDIWESDKLELQVRLLESHPNYGLVYADSLIIDEQGAPTGRRFSEIYGLPKTPSGSLFGDLVHGNFINILSVLMRKECVRQVGPFDERVRWVQDWWYWLQLSRRHLFLYLPRPLAKYRVHGRSTNVSQKRAYCLDRIKVFRWILRDYSDLAPSAKANILYSMGVDLCSLGKFGAGRRLLWGAMRCSFADVKSFGRLCKTAVRLASTFASK